MTEKKTRLWKDYEVDEGLKNEWLEHFNDLRCFDLISICTGHPEITQQYNQNPHVYLEFKSEYGSLLNNNWEKWEVDLENMVMSTCRMNTHTKLESTSDLVFREHKTEREQKVRGFIPVTVRKRTLLLSPITFDLLSADNFVKQLHASPELFRNQALFCLSAHTVMLSDKLDDWFEKSILDAQIFDGQFLRLVNNL